MRLPSDQLSAIDNRPVVALLAGPNGAGKSTVAPQLLPQFLAVHRFVNADVIARGLDGFSPESVAISAGRVMMARLKDLSSRRESFAFETTLAARVFAPWIRALQADGYLFWLVFLALSDPEMAVARVEERAASGGHRVDHAVIRRRFDRGLRNFFELYAPSADSWWLYDNSGPVEPVIVAHCASGDKTPVVKRRDVWESLGRMVR